MEYKFLITILAVSFLLSLTLVSAVPQAVFSNVNIKVTGSNNTGTYRIWGEGLDTSETFSMNNTNGTCVFSYERDSIPMQITRDITGCNDTDLGVLLNTLRYSINFTNKWEDCIKLNGQVYNNLTICQLDVGYRANYTQCESDLNSIQQTSMSTSESLKTCNTRNNDLTSQRNIILIIAAACVIFAVYSFNKNTPKKLISPMYSQLPSSQRT